MQEPIKLNCGYGRCPLDGFVNLDKRDGWMFQDGFDYATGSVDAITISHALMYLDNIELMDFLAEAYRALRGGGVIRITEDNTTDPKSGVYGGWKRDAICLTDSRMMRTRLEKAGFDVCDVSPDETHYTDFSLIQELHGKPPRVFHIEGIKP